jgi:hypothetical protein
MTRLPKANVCSPDEIPEASELRVEELRLLFAPLMASIREVVGVIGQFQEAWTAWVQRNWEAISAAREAFIVAAQIAGELVQAASAASKAFKRMLAKMQNLARLGWTLPTQLSLAELSHFVELHDSLSAEAFMLQKFDVSDPQLETMERRLLNDPPLREFRTVLPQCFRAIRREDYAIVIPNLMAMLERVIQQLNPPHLAASTDVVKTLRRGGTVARQAERDIFCAAVWLSFTTVVTELWRQYPLFTQEESTLSRPAIQHGRIEAPNSKGEVLRLLNTIESGISLHDHLSQEDFVKSPVDQEANGGSVIFTMLRASIYLPRRS